jgi:hypothetical protein
MRDWAEHAPEAPEDSADGETADVRDPNESARCPLRGCACGTGAREERRMFFVAALDEMAGTERARSACSRPTQTAPQSSDVWRTRWTTPPRILDALSGS